MGPPDRFDVAIAGAGPAGCRAAWRLASAGARVAILDGSHPREKPCGGGVTGRALELVRDAIQPEQLAGVRIQGATFEHNAQPARLQLAAAGSPELSPLVVMSRAHFDGALLTAAADAGAYLIPARVTGISEQRDGWTIATRDRSIRADWLLGADGPTSFVRRNVDRPFAREDLSIATGFYVHGCTSSDIAVVFEDEPAGYLWSFPRTDHLAVGVCAQADQSSSTVLLSIASKWIARSVAHPGPMQRYSWPIPSLSVVALRRERPSGPRWMLLGDAGGMVDPITREGIYFALASGNAAADGLLAGRDGAGRYAQEIRDAIHAELIRAARLKTQFFNPRFTRLLVHALRRSAPIRDVMSALIAGLQPYRGLRRRLLRTCELRLMMDLLRATSDVPRST